MRQNRFSCLLLVLGLVLATFLQAQELTPQELEFKRASIQINGQTLLVEYADTWELRAQGLMFRTELCQDCGMLFKFDRERLISMWMKNTLIPLDVAFFKRDGEIVEIKQMKPLDLTSVPSSAPVYYALEMNLNWFSQNGVKEGDQIKILQTGTKQDLVP